MLLPWLGEPRNIGFLLNIAATAVDKERATCKMALRWVGKIGRKNLNERGAAKWATAQWHPFAEGETWLLRSPLR